MLPYNSKQENYVTPGTDNIMNQVEKVFELEKNIEDDVDALTSKLTPDIYDKTTIDRQNKTAIDGLPIYIIIGHSSLDLNLWENPREAGTGKENICQQGMHRSAFKLNDGEIGKKITDNLQENSKWLRDEARFVIYTTPPGEWGAVYEDVTCEKPNSFLQSTHKEILSNIIANNVDIMYHKEKGLKQKKSEKRAHSAYIPGSVVPDKKHLFFGETLTEGGFGIIKLVRTGVRQDMTAATLLTKMPSDKKTNKFWFATNATSESARDPDWIKTLRDKSLEENYVLMSDIVKNGGPGFYISLSCSPIRVSIHSGCQSEPMISREGYSLSRGYPKDIPMVKKPPSPYFIFWEKLLENYNEIRRLNNAKWDLFFNSIYREEYRDKCGKAIVAGAFYMGGINNKNDSHCQKVIDDITAASSAPLTRGHHKEIQKAVKNAEESEFGKPYLHRYTPSLPYVGGIRNKSKKKITALKRYKLTRKLKRGKSKRSKSKHGKSKHGKSKRN